MNLLWGCWPEVLSESCAVLQRFLPNLVRCFWPEVLSESCAELQRFPVNLARRFWPEVLSESFVVRQSSFCQILCGTAGPLLSVTLARSCRVSQ